MHQRTWFSLLTFPLVAAFTYPVVFHQGREVARTETRGVEDPLAGMSDIQDVLALVRDNYVDSPDLDKVISGGIQAALEKAHPLNSYLTPEDLHLPDPGPAGIGIRVVKRQIYAPVLAVVPGSPAAKAGFQVGDVVRKLDGNSIGPMSTWTLERRLRGAEGSEVTLLRYAVANGDLKKITLRREKPQRPPISVRKEAKAVVLALPDLTPGRAAELKALLGDLNHALPLVLDLRLCAGGTLTEAALVAGCFRGDGPFATIQETGKADQTLATVAGNLPPFAKVAVLQGFGTLGAGEALTAALKATAIPTFGDRSAGMGVERTRFLLRQGGAAEVVNKRWLGAGGEQLGGGGERPSAPAKAAVSPAKPAEPSIPVDPNSPVPAAANPKPPASYGVYPEHPLKGLKADEDPLPKILEILEAKGKTAQWQAAPAKAKRDPLVSSLHGARAVALESALEVV